MANLTEEQKQIVKSVPIDSKDDVLNKMNIYNMLAHINRFTIDDLPAETNDSREQINTENDKNKKDTKKTEHENDTQKTKHDKDAKNIKSSTTTTTTDSENQFKIMMEKHKLECQKRVKDEMDKYEEKFNLFARDIKLVYNALKNWIKCVKRDDARMVLIKNIGKDKSYYHRLPTLQTIHHYRRYRLTDGTILKVLVVDFNTTTDCIVPELLLRHYPIYHAALHSFFENVVQPFKVFRLQEEILDVSMDEKLKHSTDSEIIQNPVPQHIIEDACVFAKRE